jgi:hypothetical protein
MTVPVTDAPGNVGTRCCRGSRRRRAGPDCCHGSCMGRRGRGRPASPGPSGCSCSGRLSCSGSVGTSSRPWRPPQPGSGTWSCSPPGPNATGWCPTGRSRTPDAPRRWPGPSSGHLLPAEPVHHPRPRGPRARRALGARRQEPHRLRGRPRRRRPRPHRPQPRGHGLHPDRPGRAHRRRTAAHWPLARDFGGFTRDHASPGRQPPWPLPERLA